MGLLRWGFKKKKSQQRQSSRHFIRKLSEVQTNPKRPSLLALGLWPCWDGGLYGMTRTKTGWWFQPHPFENYARQNGNLLPQIFGVKNPKNIWVATTQKMLGKVRWLLQGSFVGVTVPGRFFFVLSPFRELAWKPEIRDVVAFVPRVEFLHICFNCPRISGVLGKPQRRGHEANFFEKWGLYPRAPGVSPTFRIDIIFQFSILYFPSVHTKNTILIYKILPNEKWVFQHFHPVI